MGKLSTVNKIETVAWGLFVLVFFAYSFEFNQNIEIYKFGATGWPRALLLLTALAVIGNAAYHWRFGSKIQEGRIGIMEDDDSGAERDIASYFRTAAILLLPFVFAYLLKPVGFYSAAPVFIILVILLLGERRIGRVIGITVFVYLLLLLFFMVLLNAPPPQGTVSPFYDFSAQLLTWNTQFQGWMK